MRFNPRVVLVATLLLGVGTLFLFTRTGDKGKVLYYTLTEFRSDPNLASRKVRLRGKPAPGTTVRRPDGLGLEFRFNEGNDAITVRYEGAVPDAYQENLEVVAEGRLQADGTFEADQLVVKCPSKYEADKSAPAPVQG